LPLLLLLVMLVLDRIGKTTKNLTLPLPTVEWDELSTTRVTFGSMWIPSFLPNSALLSPSRYSFFIPQLDADSKAKAKAKERLRHRKKSEIFMKSVSCQLFFIFRLLLLLEVEAVSVCE